MLTPGQPLQILWNKLWIPATTLAVLDGIALIEYEAPAGHTGLVFAPAASCGPDIEQWDRNPYGYERLPRKWLDDLVERGVVWKGQVRRGTAPPPAQVLDTHFGGEAPTHGWERPTETKWTKDYLGYHLKIVRSNDRLTAYVGTLRAGVFPDDVSKTSGPWVRAATSAHTLARRLGTEIQHATVT